MISSYEIIEKYSVLVEKHSIKNQLEEYSDSLYTTVDNVYRTYDSTGFPALDPYLKKKGLSSRAIDHNRCTTFHW